jgi:anti-sigma B factor antagonist
MRQLRLEVSSDPAQLAPARRAVEVFCRECGFDSASVGEIGLVVNEAMANITRHAYAGDTNQPIRIEAQFARETLNLNLRDWGNGRDPSSVDAAYDPLTPGGLGMICLRKLMDHVAYIPQRDGMLLTMSRAMHITTGSDLVPTARRIGDSLVLQVVGEIDLHNSPELRTQVLDLLAKHAPTRLLLNLTNVPYIDSSAVAVLVEAMRRMRSVQGKLCLVDPQPRVRGIIEIARLESIFIILKDEAEALSK